MGVAAGLIGAAGGVVSGISSIFASNAQQDAANKANAQLGGTLSNITDSQKPYTTAGNQAISTMSNDVANGTGFAKAFNMNDFYNDPGYQFTLQQGTNAVNNSAAAKGGLLSGAAAKGLANYTTGLANQTYGDAFNRYMQNRQQGYNELSGIANLGQSATQNVNNAALNVGNLQAQNTIGAGNAQAAGIMGLANGLSGSMSNLGQYYMGKQSGLFGGGSGGGGGVSSGLMQGLSGLAGL